MNLFGTGPSPAEAARHSARVAELAREALALPGDARVFVTELACTEPGCPPFETVIAVMRPGCAREMHKIHKPLREVAPEDVRRLSGGGKGGC